MANEKLLDKLPDYMRPYYEPLFFQKKGEEKEWKIVKAADKLSALIKCIEEEKAGNKEFATAYQTIFQALKEMNMEEVNIFIREFLPFYDKTLDELQAM
jgi:5'-deoxynucleotidase